MGRARRTVAPTLPQVLLAVLILVVPALLPAFAYASPPDPSWIPGIYDDADYDDVVVRVTSGTANVDCIPPVASRPMPLLVENLLFLSEGPTLTPSPSASPPRAPPPS